MRSRGWGLTVQTHGKDRRTKPTTIGTQESGLSRKELSRCLEFGFLTSVSVKILISPTKSLRMVFTSTP